MKEIKCPLCNEKKWKNFLNLNEFNLLTCKNCGLIRKDFERDFYRKSEKEIYKEWYDENYHTFLEENRKIWLRWQAPKIKLIKRFKRKGNFLDVGCGLGIGVELALEEGFRVWATDIAEHATHFVKEKFGIPVYTGELESLDLPEKFFDVIYTNHVLEHVLNPFIFLKRIKFLLKKDGIALISVPNIKSVYFKIYQKRFPIFQREHLWYFNIYTLRSLIKRSGLQLFYYTTGLSVESQGGWISTYVDNINKRQNITASTTRLLRKLWRLIPVELRRKGFYIVHKSFNFVFPKLKMGDDLIVIVKK